MALPTIEIPPNRKVIIGRPSSPPSKAITSAVSNIFEQILGCSEAHLPQVFIFGAMDLPRLALVLVCKRPSEIDELASAWNNELIHFLPADCSLDLLVIPDTDPLLDAVRRAGCQVSARCV
jgi:hypothetical protein